MRHLDVFITFLVYMVGMWVVGLFCSPLIKSLTDFLVAGRRLGPWVTAMTHEATAHSAYVYQAVPGQAFMKGLQNIWITLPAIAKPYVNFIGLGRRLRMLSERLNCLTFPDLLEARFEDRTRSLRILSTLITIFFMEIYVAGQIVGAARLLEQITGANYTAMVFVMGGTVVLYCVAGGFFAVAWTDFLQGILMVIGFIIMSVVVFGEVGLTALMEQLKGVDVRMVSTAVPFWAAVGWLTVVFGFIGSPHIIIRFFAIRRGFKTLRVATLVSLLWVTLIFYAGTYVGMAGRVLVPDLKNPENVVMELALIKLPGVVAGIIASAIMAAIMSSVDSQLLTAASGWARDLYQKVMNPQVGDDRIILHSRLALIVFGVIGMLIALYPPKLLFEIILFAWAVLGSLAPFTIAACYWRWATRQGVFWGMLSGFIVVVAWHYLGWTTYTYEMLPGVAVGTLVLIVVSLFTPRGRASQKVTALLDEFKAPSPVPDIARSEASELWAAKAWLLSRGAVEGSG